MKLGLLLISVVFFSGPTMPPGPWDGKDLKPPVIVASGPTMPPPPIDIPCCYCCLHCCDDIK